VSRLEEETMQRIPITLCLSLVAGACVSTQAEPHDAARRKALLDSVKALEGTWQAAGANGELHVTEFKVSSAGSVVREIMFPGTAEEMTNVYRLEGNVLALTHYCAMGNQPELRAVARTGNRLEFGFVGVLDLDKPDEVYMGALMLEFVDQDHLVEHWRSFVQGKLLPEHSVDLAFTRRK
jgi:type IV secretory pathway TrbL component